MELYYCAIGQLSSSMYLYLYLYLYLYTTNDTATYYLLG